MSSWAPTGVRCAGCAAAFEVPIQRGLHISRLPEVRASILDNTFQVFPCPCCGYSNRVEVSTILTDFERGEYIGVEGPFPDDWREAKTQHSKVFTETVTLGPDVAGALTARLRHRVVFGHQALREKLLLSEAGLDDRAVEAVKGDVLRAEGLDPWAQLLRVSAVLDGGHLLFARLKPHPPQTDRNGALTTPNPALLGHVTVTHDRYEARWLGRQQLREDYPWLVDEWVVDLWVTCPSRPPLQR